jgi:hypothetical protein
MVLYETWRVLVSLDRTRREREYLEFVEGERVGEWDECWCREWSEWV